MGIVKNKTGKENGHEKQREDQVIARLFSVRHWVLKEMDAVIDAGMYSGPQSVLIEHFLPGGTQYIKTELSPPPTPREVVCVLNDLIKEGKLSFLALEATDKTVRTWLKVP